MASNTKWIVWKSKETGQGKQKEKAWLNSVGVCILQEKERERREGGRASALAVMKTGLNHSILCRNQ
jgi:hypothetical protein